MATDYLSKIRGRVEVTTLKLGAGIMLTLLAVFLLLALIDFISQRDDR